jgi:hypothetical protein
MEELSDYLSSERGKRAGREERAEEGDRKRELFL